MALKVIGLCASPRPQGNTRKLLDYFLEQCRELGAETEVFSSPEHRVDFCCGCEQCMRLGTCPLKDEYLPLLPKILAADAVVIASPNYAFDVSAQCKAVMDRSHAFLYYRQALAGKYGVGICVGGHWARTRSIAQWCGQAVWLCGGKYVGAAWGVSKVRDKKGFVNEGKVYARADRLAHKLMKTMQTKKTYPLQTWFRDTFIIRSLWQGLIRREREYPWIAQEIRRQEKK